MSKTKRTFQVVTENGEPARVHEVPVWKIWLSLFVTFATAAGIMARIVWALATPLVDERIDAKDAPLAAQVRALAAEHGSLATKEQLSATEKAILRAVARVEKQLDDAVDRQANGGSR